MTRATAALSVAVTSTKMESPGSRLSCGTSTAPVTVGGTVSATASMRDGDAPRAEPPDAVAVNVSVPTTGGAKKVSTAMAAPSPGVWATNVSARATTPCAVMTIRSIGKDPTGVATAVTSTDCKGRRLVAGQVLVAGALASPHAANVTVMSRGPVVSPWQLAMASNRAKRTPARGLTTARTDMPPKLVTRGRVTWPRSFDSATSVRPARDVAACNVGIIRPTLHDAPQGSIKRAAV